MTDRLVTDPVFRAASAMPGKIAIVCGGESVTYGDLAARVRACAIQARRVRIVARNGIETIAGLLAVWAAGAEAEIVDPALRRAPPEPPTSDPASFLIVYTSGTTGAPKAISRTHASWLASFAASAVELGTSPRSVVLAPGPLAHGLTLYAVIETLAAGGTIHLLPRFDPRASLEGINTLVAAPTICDLLVDAGASSSGLTRIITAGSKLSPALRARMGLAFPAAETIEYYGASELSFVTVAKSSERAPSDSVGRAFHGAAIDVRDGIVWVKSKMISHGYLGAVDGAGFRRDGDWATVGDRGAIDRNGFLTLLGREGDMIVTAGVNVYPSEVESVLESHPAIETAAVFGIDDPRWGQVVAAAVVMRAGTTFDRGALEAHCRGLLPSAKVPRRWVCAPALPRTTSGKVIRAGLSSLVS
jgi:acyl-CoA synthetase (AMP-forming)/AMP-acid ligase II